MGEPCDDDVPLRDRCAPDPSLTRGLAPYDAGDPRSPWSPVLEGHVRFRPVARRTHNALWEASRARRDVLWACGANFMRDRAAALPPLPSYAADPPAFWVDALVVASEDEAETLLDHLAAWLEQAPDDVSWWVGELILTITGPVGMSGSLYDQAIEALRKADRHGSKEPTLLLRFASILSVVLHEVDPIPQPSPPPAAAVWPEWLAQWRSAFQDWELSCGTGHAFRVLLIPGAATGDTVEDAAAAGPTVERARAAMKTIHWHVEQCPPGQQVVVLCSGGNVRSIRPEAALMAEFLADKQNWQAEADLWLDLPNDQLRIVQDGLARHSMGNVRSGAQLAARLGLKELWVQTDAGHVGYHGDWRTVWEKDTTLGLDHADRKALRAQRPLRSLLCGVGVNRPYGRVRFVDLWAAIHVAAVGDALNP